MQGLRGFHFSQAEMSKNEIARCSCIHTLMEAQTRSGASGAQFDRHIVESIMRYCDFDTRLRLGRLFGIHVDIPADYREACFAGSCIAARWYLMAGKTDPADGPRDPDAELAVIYACTASPREYMRIYTNVNALDWGLICACRCGHADLARFMLERGASKIGKAFVAACAGLDDMSLIGQLAGERSASDVDGGLRYAAANGSLDVVKFLVEERRATDVSGALTEACSSDDLESRGRRLECIRYLLERGANDFRNAVYWAARSDFVEALELLCTARPHMNLTLGLIAACTRGRANAVRCLVNHGAADLDFALRRVSANGDMPDHVARETASFLIERGARDIAGAAAAAARPELAAWLITKLRE